MGQDQGLCRATGATSVKRVAGRGPAQLSQAEALRLSEIEMNRQLSQPRQAPPFHLPPPAPSAAKRAQQAEALRRSEEEISLSLLRRSAGGSAA